MSLLNDDDREGWSAATRSVMVKSLLGGAAFGRRVARCATRVLYFAWITPVGSIAVDCEHLERYALSERMIKWFRLHRVKAMTDFEERVELACAIDRAKLDRALGTRSEVIMATEKQGRVAQPPPGSVA